MTDTPDHPWKIHTHAGPTLLARHIEPGDAWIQIWQDADPTLVIVYVDIPPNPLAGQPGGKLAKQMRRDPPDLIIPAGYVERFTRQGPVPQDYLA